MFSMLTYASKFILAPHLPNLALSTLFQRCSGLSLYTVTPAADRSRLYVTNPKLFAP